jgi:hypothetical protein
MDLGSIYLVLTTDLYLSLLSGPTIPSRGVFRYLFRQILQMQFVCPCILLDCN